MIGIGVTTYNRNEIVKKCITNIIKNTNSEYRLIVIDDFSIIPVSDERCLIKRMPKNSGIAKCKNECLRFLNDCEHIFLFDDDCWPIKKEWETKYIESSKEFDNNVLCYGWESESFNYFEALEKIVTNRKITLKCGTKETVLSEEEYLSLNEFDTNNRIKRSLGYFPWTPHVIEIELLNGVVYRKNGAGVMIYMNRKTINTLGGFYEKFGIYGGEHIDLFIRAYNCGLTKNKFPDILNSESYIEALDKYDFHESTVKDKKKFYSRIDSLLEKRKNSIEKIVI